MKMASWNIITLTSAECIGNMKLDDIKLIYSGSNDGVYMQGVVLIMNEEAVKSCYCY